MNTPPASRLTLARPDLWDRALLLASGLTGYAYAEKVPLADGTILMCGAPSRYKPPTPPKPKAPEEQKRERIAEIEGVLERLRRWIEDANRSIEQKRSQIAEWEAEIRQHEDELAKLRTGLITLGLAPAPVVAVPEGAMEWLLHEIGHWMAATPAERLLPDYGYGQGVLLGGLGAARELQAWAFEEIVLAPFGRARDFCPPEHQGGTAFERDVRPEHFHHIEARMRVQGFDVEQFRALYGEWARWDLATRAEA